MQHFRAFLALAFATSLTFTSTAEARLTRLEISKREIVADAWRSEPQVPTRSSRPRLVEADPVLERNTAVFDIDRAPLNAEARGGVFRRYVILKPVDMAKGAATLFFEVNNRGRKIPSDACTTPHRTPT